MVGTAEAVPVVVAMAVAEGAAADRRARRRQPLQEDDRCSRRRTARTALLLGRRTAHLRRTQFLAWESTLAQTCKAWAPMSCSSGSKSYRVVDHRLSASCDSQAPRIASAVDGYQHPGEVLPLPTSTHSKAQRHDIFDGHFGMKLHHHAHHMCASSRSSATQVAQHRQRTMLSFRLSN